MSAKRKHLSKSGPQLQELFEANEGNQELLLELMGELKHRSTPSARALLKRVEKALGHADASNQQQHEKNATSQPASAKVPKSDEVVSCRHCQTNLRVAVLPERTGYTCPNCDAEFEAIFTGDVLQVIWQESRTSNARDAEMNEAVAREVLGVGRDADFATIKKAWRKASQQYHPDKHQDLPDRLKFAAEIEMKRINEAYTYLERITAAEF